MSLCLFNSLDCVLGQSCFKLCAWNLVRMFALTGPRCGLNFIENLTSRLGSIWIEDHIKSNKPLLRTLKGPNWFNFLLHILSVARGRAKYKFGGMLILLIVLFIHSFEI